MVTTNRNFVKEFCIYEKCLTCTYIFAFDLHWHALCFVHPFHQVCYVLKKFFEKKCHCFCMYALHECIVILPYPSPSHYISAFMAWECMPVSLHDTCSCTTLQSVCVVSACSISAPTRVSYFCCYVSLCACFRDFATCAPSTSRSQVQSKLRWSHLDMGKMQVHSCT